MARLHGFTGTQQNPGHVVRFYPSDYSVASLKGVLLKPTLLTKTLLLEPLCSPLRRYILWQPSAMLLCSIRAVA